MKTKTCESVGRVKSQISGRNCGNAGDSWAVAWKNGSKSEAVERRKVSSKNSRSQQ